MDHSITAWSPDVSAAPEPVAIKKLESHTGGVIALSCNARWVVSGSLDSSVKVWSATGAMELVHAILLFPLGCFLLPGMMLVVKLHTPLPLHLHNESLAFQSILSNHDVIMASP